MFVYNLSTFITFAASPLVLTPFVRNQGVLVQPAAHRHGLQGANILLKSDNSLESATENPWENVIEHPR